MASWTTPVTHVAGDVLAVSDWNGLANDATFLYEPPYGAYYNSSATSIPSASTTQVTLGGTDASNYGFSVSSNNLVVPIAGTYIVMFLATLNTISPGGSGTEYMQVTMQQNGTSKAIGSDQPMTMAYPSSAGGRLCKCSANDTLGLYIYQNSGGSLNTLAGLNTTYLHAVYQGAG